MESSISSVKGGVMTWGIYFFFFFSFFFPRQMKYMQKTIHDLVLTLQVIRNT